MYVYRILLAILIILSGCILISITVSKKRLNICFTYLLGILLVIFITIYSDYTDKIFPKKPMSDAKLKRTHKIINNLTVEDQ